ncbi:hypothetical protein J4Q44_G00265670 [Coregonus suidteri]|uniref:C-type lectin domain-containing protein n=1 Tax=Coregonus suidteri TaxID=861788 RepID=A0AAN8QUC0_9TELE
MRNQKPEARKRFSQGQLAVPPTASSQYPGECIQEEEQIGVWNSPWSWLPFRGHCYSFVNDDIEWAYASTSCIHKGASLVSIEDPEELRFIKSNIELLKDSYSSFWIGLYKTHLAQSSRNITNTCVSEGRSEACVFRPGSGGGAGFPVSDGSHSLMLYKKTGRPLPSFTKPLVFSAGWRAFDNPLYTEPVTEVDVVNPSTVDTSQLVKHMEEQAQPMITL